MNNLGKKLLDFLFPKKCIGCKRQDVYLCKNCIGKVRKNKKSSNFVKPEGLDEVIWAWKYEGIIKKAIALLKYKFAYSIAEELVDNFVNNLNTSKIPKKAVLIPVPMHKKRKRVRGFNQTEKLGKIVAERLNIKYDSNLIKKVKNTSPQVGLARKMRLKNVKASFKMVGKIPKEYKSYKIIIFDDVFTTGSTLKEIAKEISTISDSEIIGLTVARS